MRNCIHLTTQLHNNCTLNCMTCTPLRLGVQARPVSNVSCYSYGLTGKFRPSSVVKPVTGMSALGIKRPFKSIVTIVMPTLNLTIEPPSPSYLGNGCHN